MKQAFFLMFALFLVASCANNAENQADSSAEATENEQEATAEDLNVDSLQTSIESYRVNIEDNLDNYERQEMSTEGMREQISQKWAMIHYYMDGDELVRVKTYPHEETSTRTEEFYFQDGELVCAVIEDDGLSEQGKESDLKGKAYYYHDGTAIAEMNNTGETEYSIRDSDAERLMQEAKEYQGAVSEM